MDSFSFPHNFAVRVTWRQHWPARARILQNSDHNVRRILFRSRCRTHKLVWLLRNTAAKADVHIVHYLIARLVLHMTKFPEATTSMVDSEDQTAKGSCVFYTVYPA